MMWSRLLRATGVLAILTLTVLLPGAANAAGVLHRGNGSEPDTLDPHLASGNWENQIIGDMIMGLFTEGPDGKTTYGAAESHSVSEDGLVWTFKIRDHLWSDGTPVSAEDFVFAWQRILTPATSAQYASLIAGEFKNGRAILEGEAGPETLGARAIDARTLELTLEHPAPYLPQLMTHYTTWPVPKHVVERDGRDWVRPGKYVGNGAYTLVEWVPNSHVKLQRNPRFYDAANVKIDEVFFYPTTDTSAALKKFRAGELDMQNGLSSQDIDWIKQNIPQSLHLKPYLAVSYIAINNTRPPLTDIRVRKALSLAFDRETIASKVLKFEEQPAYSLVPPGVSGFPGGNDYAFKTEPHEQRLARAKELMQQAGFGPGNRLRLGFITGSQPDNKRFSAALQQMWKEIFVDIDITQLEVKTVYNLMRQTDFDVGTAAWVADFDDAKNFLYLFRTDSNEMNYGKYTNPEFDRLMQESDQVKDETERGKILARAEKIVLDDYAFVPNRFLNVRHIVQPYVHGFEANMRDAHRTRWMSIDRPAGQQPPVPSSSTQPARDSAVAEERSWGDWLAGLTCAWFGVWCAAP